MNIKTKNKEINIVLRTRKIVDITKKLDGKNFEEAYFKAVSEKNIEAFAQIIFLLAENEDKTVSFKDIDEVYDFIDDYKLETQKSFTDLISEITEVINDEGFFNTKMSKKDLQAKLTSPLSLVNMREIIKNSAEKAVNKLTEEQFQGYRA